MGKPKNIPDVEKPDRDRVMNMLASRERILRQYINYLNQQEGLPLAEYGERGDIESAYMRLRAYAVRQGWLQKE